MDWRLTTHGSFRRKPFPLGLLLPYVIKVGLPALLEYIIKIGLQAFLKYVITVGPPAFLKYVIKIGLQAFLKYVSVIGLRAFPDYVIETGLFYLLLDWMLLQNHLLNLPNLVSFNYQIRGATQWR